MKLNGKLKEGGREEVMRRRGYEKWIRDGRGWERVGEAKVR